MKKSFMDTVLGRTIWPARAELVRSIRSKMLSDNGKLAAFGLEILVARYGLEDETVRDLDDLLTTTHIDRVLELTQELSVLDSLLQKHLQLVHKAQKTDYTYGTSTAIEAGLVKPEDFYFARYVDARAVSGNPLSMLEWAYRGIGAGLKTLTSETKRSDPRLLRAVRGVLNILEGRDARAASEAAKHVLDASTLHVVPRWWSCVGLKVSDGQVDTLPKYLQSQHSALMPVRQVASAYLLKSP